jgi:DNA sulfur modification protein DndD
MKVKNFRQFIGEQSIEFSVDPDKNVTVIMGGNGSGKTTLAQAFTWCLYGDTDFEDKSVLCKTIAQNMKPNEQETVQVELSLFHNSIEYTITRKQNYCKDSNGKMKKPGQTEFSIAYRDNNGNIKFVKDLETEFRMQEILPRELSRYFFFDGERIDKMGKEIRSGKSKEFAQAVRNLLGLSAITSALNHLNGKNMRTTVMKLYENSYDPNSNSKILEYTAEIERYTEEIEKIDRRLEEIDKQENIAKDKCDELNRLIFENSESVELAEKRKTLKDKLEGISKQRSDTIEMMLKMFNSTGPSYFAKKLIEDALGQLSESDKLDKGIPDITEKTIEYLIKRGSCICGAEIVRDNEAYKHLNEILEYIPPHSIGSVIRQFVNDCEQKSRNGKDLFENISSIYRIIKETDVDYNDIEEEIKNIEIRLQGMKDVGLLQKDLQNYEVMLQRFKDERDELNKNKGYLEKSLERCETERQRLAVRDSNNRKIEIYKAYVEYMYDTLNEIYTQQEKEMRKKLENTVNEIFKKIYNGGFSLAIDDKYNIQVIADELRNYEGEIETSTAQSISIIFAFISGVIKLARQSQDQNMNDSLEPESLSDSMLTSEPYPLVMDAPLSAFDKTRIKTVCETLPEVAEQVIIFIKDTDGELAEEYMKTRIGARYLFNKINEFETRLVER